tara:strand:+ start:4505 stop:5839 length:1335 start_codon:yes stop_codon:yes gene_type:complete
MRFKKKNIGILGLGKSGYWSAKLAKSLNNNVFISDSNKNVNQMFIDDLKMLGIDLEIGIHSNQILKSDIIIKSPGIPNDLEIMKKISAEKIPVISEIEFAGKISNTKNICITGTNGKTTTVSLLTEILSKEKNVLKSGNIGIPFSKIVLENKLYDKNDIDYCILELSSFQLEHCKSLKKEISVILNISVDHMDRYDTIEEYFKTKLKIFDNAKYCLFNYDDNFLKKRIDSNRRNTIPFSITKNKGHYYYDNDKICSDDLNFSFDIDSISIKGIHNISNIIIAADIAYMIGISNDNIYQALREFKSLDHRFEHFHSYEGIDFINDSKSTNIDSVKKALESISKKVILILGGIPKEDDFSEILLFKKNILKIIVYGEAADKVYNSLSKDIDVERIDQFENAVHFALESAIESSVVLLSPACASFDQFNNYQERGIKFKNIVERFYA